MDLARRPGGRRSSGQSSGIGVMTECGEARGRAHRRHPECDEMVTLRQNRAAIFVSVTFAFSREEQAAMVNRYKFPVSAETTGAVAGTANRHAR